LHLLLQPTINCQTRSGNSLIADPKLTFHPVFRKSS
jgi:hypothetical protein